MLDNLGDPLPGQSVTMSIWSNPPGTGTLTGTLTQTTDSNGSATFPDLKIDWLGTFYTLLASATPSSGTVSATSVALNELRVGDACFGPDTPACKGTCSDADGDGLNDAWEIAGGVDINGDSVISDRSHDLLLTGADPNTSDVFLYYDYTFASDHNHNPPPEAIKYVVDAFAVHGVNLHVDAQHNAIDETQAQVVTLQDPPDPVCAGNSAMSLAQLKSDYLSPQARLPLHGLRPLCLMS